MVFPKARLVVAGLLFAGWLIYLAVLVARTRDLIVVSRPQILVSNLCVVAKIEAQDGRAAPAARVTRVLWADEPAPELVDTRIELPELAELEKAQGWSGPDEYLLALTKRRLGKGNYYALTPIPEMPGFQATVPHETRIYRATDDVLRQFHELKPRE